MAMLDYARLAEVEVPEGMHVVLVDPPPGPEQAAWAVHRAAGHWLHLVWGEPETDLALRVAEDEWELRPAVTALWTGLRDGAPRGWGPELEAILLGDGPASRLPRVAARALNVLAELSLVTVSAEGVRALPDPERRELEASAIYRACAARLEDVRAHLAVASGADLYGAAQRGPEILVG